MKKNTLQHLFVLAIITCLSISICQASDAVKGKMPARITISHETLMDKIKGGWAGQVIGCTYGGPTEFVYRGKMIGDEKEIPWKDPDYVGKTMRRVPTLYDDIYMDLTFVGVFERLGIHAPVDSLANAFAHAGYHLWHANQAARYNILRGIRPPMSGHWKNNPHADDIDYQIEADYAGIMAPGMPNTASKISDKIGHIMNYGNGWYGGVYMGAMYSIAFVSQDIEFIVSEALKSIPKKSQFYQCMKDVIDICHTYPDDWRKGWQACEDRWGKSDVGCSEGALDPLNIDAMINSAYVVFGLLYGKGDFGKTIDISTRCGQDSDCNPASAAGILATAIGYSQIPEKWLAPLKKAEDIKFAYTPYSLNDTYQMSFSQALQVIQENGGKVTDKEISIKCQKPKAVRFEESFPNLTPYKRQQLQVSLDDKPYTFTANCASIVINGVAKSANKDYVAELEIYVDGQKKEKILMPALYRLRRLDLYWDYDLKPGEHTFTIRWLNPIENATVKIPDAVLYKRIK